MDVSSLAMDTDNCEEMVLFIDADSIDDMRNVLRAVRKKCKKGDMETSTKEMACGSSSGVPYLSKKKRLKSVEKGLVDMEEENLSLGCVKLPRNEKKKKLNGRLKRLFAKKERMRSMSETSEDVKAMEEVETNSTDSGIDMTDLIKNFDDHVTKSNESELSCGQCGTASSSKNGKRKRSRNDADNQNSVKKQCTELRSCRDNIALDRFDKSRIVGLDCEFVGVGPCRSNGLGRCSIVNYDGKVLCDIYSQPEEPITDYRTRWSGIRKKDMVNAVPFSHAQNHIRRILQDKIIVGHALHFDFRVLGIYPPAQLVRDTSKYIPLRKMLEDKLGAESRGKFSLKTFSKHLLGREIQGGEHCSVEDSVAALDLYKLVEDQWETDVAIPSSEKATASNLDQGNSHSYFADSYWPDDVLNDNYE